MGGKLGYINWNLVMENAENAEKLNRKKGRHNLVISEWTVLVYGNPFERKKTQVPFIT